MEALIAFFALGTVWFYITSIIFLILLFYCVEHELLVRSGIIVFGYFLFLQFFTQVNIFGRIAEKPLLAVGIFSGYFIIGFIWSAVKWWLFVNRQAIDYKRKRLEFLESVKERLPHFTIESSTGYSEPLTLDTPVPEKLMDDWKRYIGCGYKVPQVHTNKNKISTWVIYWPTPVIWSLLNDFIRKTIDVIIIKIRFIYDSITKGAFKNVKEF